MSIQQTPATESLIGKMIATGDYADAAAVIEDAVRFLEAHQRKERIIQAVVDALAQVERGEFYEDSEEFWVTLRQEAEELDRQGIPIDPEVFP